MTNAFLAIILSAGLSVVALAFVSSKVCYWLAQHLMRHGQGLDAYHEAKKQITVPALWVSSK